MWDLCQPFLENTNVQYFLIELDVVVEISQKSLGQMIYVRQRVKARVLRREIHAFCRWNIQEQEEWEQTA